MNTEKENYCEGCSLNMQCNKSEESIKECHKKIEQVEIPND